MKRFVKKFLPLFLVLFSCSMNMFATKVNEQDSLALVDLYNSTNGSNWVNKQNWLVGPVSSWAGVYLSADKNRVEQLMLNAKSLSGTIPSSIGDLTGLIYLSMSNNYYLTGNLPSSIGNLIQLEQLWFASTQINGTIPKSIGNLKKLRILYIIPWNGKGLEGEVPVEIGELTNLETIFLGGNSSLTGSFPDNISNLTKLTYFDASHAKFSAMPAIPRSAEINISNNNLTFDDVIPNLSASKITYTPQANIGTSTTSSICEGASFRIDLNIDAAITDNIYKWKLNGVLYATTNTNYLSIAAVKTTDGGTFTCQVTNPRAPLLTLYSCNYYLTVLPLSVITTQPVNISETEGTVVNFSITATNTILSYLWQRSPNGTNGWSDINNSNSNVYSEGAVSGYNGYYYRCIITGECNTLTSTAAQLTVLPCTRITQQPRDTTVCSGNTATFTVVASGTSLSYQWKESTDGSTWTNISGATNTSLSVTSISDKWYMCIVSGTTGTIGSYAAKLTRGRLAVATNLTSQQGCANTLVTFNAYTHPSFSYQWQVSTNSGTSYSNILGATEGNYQVTATTANNGYKYRYIASTVDGCTDISTAATLTLNTNAAAPTITTQPTDRSICEGSFSSAIQLTTNSTANTAYQWQRSKDGGETWADFGNNSYWLNLIGHDSINGNFFRCVVSGNCAGASVTSSVAKVTVVPKNILISAPDVDKICIGDALSFAVSSSGAPNETYQWYFYGPSTGGIATNFDGATSPTFSTTADYKAFGTIACRVYNNACYTSWLGKAFTSASGLAITLQPVSYMVECVGNTATLTVAATSNNGTPSYEWEYYNSSTGTWISTGATSASYSFTVQEDRPTYHCKISDNCGVLYSHDASIDITKAPELLSQPEGGTFCEGDEIYTYTDYSGIDVYYKWYLSADGGSTWNESPDNGGYDAMAYWATASTDMSGNLLKCILNNTCGSTESDGTAQLFVNHTAKITSQPVNVGVCVGGSAQFKVIAENADYSWYRSTNNGSTWSSMEYYSSELVIANVQASWNKYQYKCLLTSDCGTTFSNAALLIIGHTINRTPASKTVCEGNTATFSVSAVGYNLSYQWQQSTDGGLFWNNLSGATGASYSVASAIVSSNGYQYRCKVVDGCGNQEYTGSALLTVKKNTKIVTQIYDQTVCAGNSVSFNIEANGTSLTYQWYYSPNGGTSWLTISGATSPVYEISSAASSQNGYKYLCLVSGACGEVYSERALLTVNTPNDFILQPTSQAVCEGDTAFFKYAFSGTDPYYYEWNVSFDGGNEWNYLYNEGNDPTAYSVIATSDMNAVQYKAIVYGICNTVESNVASMVINQPVTITSNPVSQSICAGNSVSFTIEANGTSLTYQWQYSSDGGSSWLDISGANASVYEISAAASTQNGYKYQCLVSGACGTVNSAEVLLTVNTPNEFILQPTTQAVCEGNSAFFKLAVTGTTPNSYEWNNSLDGGNTWNNLNNEGNDPTAYSVIATSDMNAVQYKAIVYGICNTVESNVASMVINQPVTITSNPVSQSICAGNSVSFNIEANGTSLMYQWQYSSDGGSSWLDISGANASVYEISAAASTQNGYKYQCLVSGACGTVNSAEVLLTVNTPNEFILQPTSKYVCEGNSTFFKIAVTGTTPYSYEWNNSLDWGNTWNNLNNEGDDPTVYSLVATLDKNKVQYKVIVHGVCNTLKSNVSVLWVNQPVTITSNPASQSVCNGASVSFSVEAQGSINTYIWRYSTNNGASWKSVQGARNSTLSITALSTMNNYLYKCIVNGLCGNVESSVVTLHVDGPVITSQPASVVTCLGNSVTFSIATSGTVQGMQWRISSDNATWTDLTGEIGTQYTTVLDANNTGKYYQCVVSGTCGLPVYSQSALLRIAVAPIVTQQPVATSVCESTTATFTIAATGDDLHYQWQKYSYGTWIEIAGAADSPVYSFSPTSLDDGKLIRCHVYGPCDSVSTGAAVLTVKFNPTIITASSDQEVCPGETATFSVGAAGTGITQQWELSTDNGTNWHDITDATSDTYSFTSQSSMDGYLYRSRVVGECETFHSDSVKLTMPYIQIQTQPVTATACQGSTTGFGVSAKGSGLTFQWQIYPVDTPTWRNINSATDSILSVLAVPPYQGNQYRCIVGGLCGLFEISNAASLLVTTTPSIITQPVNQTASEGSLVQFTALADGGTYQWQSGVGGAWTDIDGATLAAYQFVATDTMQGYYRCVFANNCTSNKAELTIKNPTIIALQPQSTSVCTGVTASFTAKGTGFNLTYQWQKSISGSWTNIVGATNSTFNIIATVSDIGQYRCLVADYAGLGAYTDEVTLTVYTATNILGSPISQTVCEDVNAIFSTTGEGKDLTWQWQQSADNNTWADIEGATSAGLTVNANISKQGYYFKAIASSSCGANGATTIAQLTIIPNVRINSNPASVATCPGSSASFSVGATGEDLKYQWIYTQNGNSFVMNGATGPSYSIASVSTAMHNQYFMCKVSGTCGVRTSVPVRLTTGPQVVSHPDKKDTCRNIIAIYDGIRVKGPQPFTYQWQESGDSCLTWTDIAGAIQEYYKIYTAVEKDSFYFRCIITGSCGIPDTTNNAYLHLKEAQVIKQPVNDTVCAGAKAQFAITGAGLDPKYLWEESADGISWQAIANATNKSYSFTAGADKNNYQYHCIVTDKCGTATSEAVSLIVQSNPFAPLMAQITSITCEDSTNDGSIVLNNPEGGTEPYAYNWSNGETSTAIYSLPAGDYKVDVTDAHGCIASFAGQVGYEAPIEIAEFDITNIHFAGDSVGSIQTSVSGGHTPVSLLWSNGTQTEDLAAIPAGTYQIKVTDAKGCVKKKKGTVSEPVGIYTDQTTTGSHLKSGTTVETACIEGRVLDTGKDIGTIPGSAGVSATGALTYTLPIATLPGLGGLEPQLSVVYNSQAGNGLLGWGTNLSGISVITRSPKTVYSNGNSTGINIDITDDYALDGNRLVLNGTATYGADKSTYRTESETFVNITANGNYNSTGPEWFEVEAKNGTKYFYGTHNGKFLYEDSEKKAIAAWYLDSVSDLYGNYVTYNYNQNGLHSYLTDMSYGGNSTKGIECPNKVELFYAYRKDTIHLHYGMKTGVIDHVLNAINVTYDNTLYRRYDLAYSYDAYSRLKQVSLSNGDEKQLNPTVFKWGTYLTNVDSIESQLPTVQKATHFTNNFDGQSYVSADMNGDGLSDLIGFYTNSGTNLVRFYYAKQNATGGIDFETDLLPYNIGSNALITDFFRKSINIFVSQMKLLIGYSHKTNNPIGGSIGDLDGDGLNECVFARVYNGNVYFRVIGKNTAGFANDEDDKTQNFNTANKKLTFNDDNPQYSIVDIDNDGFDDIVMVERGLNAEGNYILSLWTIVDGERKWTSFPLPGDLGRDALTNIIVADFDGDGLADLMLQVIGRYCIFKNKGGGVTTNFSGYTEADWSLKLSGNDKVRLGDFNGDGLIDMMVWYPLTSAGRAIDVGTIKYGWDLLINKGGFVFEKKNMPQIAELDDTQTGKDDDQDDFVVTDFDQDGKSDVIVFDAVYRWTNNWILQYWKILKQFDCKWYHSTGDSLVLVKSTQSNDGNDAYARLHTLGDFNGDGRTELLNYGFDYAGGIEKDRKWRMYDMPNVNHAAGLITSTSNGFNQTSCFSYMPLTVPITNNGVYQNTATNRAGSLKRAFTSPLYVVSEAQSDNGIGGKSKVAYSYDNAISHVQGKGFLGFQKTKQTNAETNVSVSALQEFEDKYFTLHSQTSETFVGTELTARTINLSYYTSLGGSHLMPSMSVVYTKDILKGNNAKSTSYYDYENKSGNLTQQNDSIQTDLQLNHRLYSNFDKFGNPKTVSTKYTRKNETAVTQSSTVEYTNFGRVESSVVDNLTTSYTYDDFGNLLSQAINSPGMVERKSTSQYTPDGRFLYKQFDAQNHFIEYAHNQIGQVTSQKDINQAETKQVYDSWGVLTQTTDAEGNVFDFQRAWVSGADAPAHGLYYTSSKRNNLFTGSTYFDLLGRSVKTLSTGFDGQITTSSPTYNAKGQTESVKVSYSKGSDADVTNYTYDSYLRPLTKKGPDEVLETYTYTLNSDGLYNPTTTFDYTLLGTTQSYSKTFDGAGLMLSATDPGGTVSYDYNSLGKARTITSLGSSVSMTYDNYGTQLTLKDPNAGTTTYTYNGFNELATQMDGQGNKETMTYDLLGRVLTQTTEKAGSVPSSFTLTNAYDEGTKALGTLSSVISSDGAQTHYTYSEDGLCRKTSDTQSQLNGESFTHTYTYDTKGRLQTTTSPSGMKLTYEYTDYDDPLILSATIGSKTSIVWEATLVNDKNQLRIATIGKNSSVNYQYDDNDRLNSITAPNINFSYTYNQKGQLENRNEKFLADNVWKGISEDFKYDGVNRLKTCTGSQALELVYDPDKNDRIKSKTDAGTYGYSGTGNHKLDNLTTVSSYSPVFHRLSYTGFNKVASLIDSVDEQNVKMLTLTYGTNQQRFKTEYAENGATKLTRYYAGTYEKEIHSSGTLRHIDYVFANGSLVAMHVQNNGADSMYYVYTDRQGSLRCITDDEGNVLQRLAFDAWGNRRDPLTGVKLTSTEIATKGWLTPRAYTGHEHLDKFGLINMNGRVYDPAIGLFLSPDNYVQSPTNSQNFNRYSYCLNNPLSYTDPSGNIIEAIIAAAFIGMEVNVMMNEQNINNSGDFCKYAMVGAASGAAGAAVGDLFGSGGGFLNGFLNGAASSATGNFISGSGNAWINGADFATGLKVGAVNAAWGALIGGTINGLITGINDYYHGCSFWNGTGVDAFYTGFTSAETSGNYYNNSDMAEMNDEALKLKYYDKWGVKEGEIAKTITTKTSQGMGMLNTFEYVDPKGNIALGYFEYTTKNMEIKIIHISPAALRNDVLFEAVAGHEWIHAYHYSVFTNWGYDNEYSEKVAYKYTYNTFRANGNFDAAAKVAQKAKELNYLGEYPSSYEVPSMLRVNQISTSFKPY